MIHHAKAWGLMVALALFFLAPGPDTALAQEADSAEATIARAAELDDTALFDAARALTEQGNSVLPPIRRALKDQANPRGRILAAKVALDMGRLQDAALDALRDVLLEGDDPSNRLLAAGLLEVYAGGAEDVAGLKKAAESIHNPRVKISVARLLYLKAADIQGMRILRDYLKSEDPAIRAEAALALGELGNVEAAKDILDSLQDEPTPRGRRARALLLQEKLYESLSETAGVTRESEMVQVQKKRIEDLEAEVEDLKKRLSKGGSLGSDLLNEIQSYIKDRYDYEDPSQIEEKELIDAAAKGMVSSLDPFSSYMTEEETRAFEESMKQEYAGIGAVVSMDPQDRLLTIMRPIYSGPAYEAGLRSLDKITKVEGESTYGKTLEELVSSLKGEEGTKVTIEVYRRGWKEPREFELTRQSISVPSVLASKLPGDIGYIQLEQFGQKATEEVEAALKELEAKGIKGLILDLRGNPGGLLTAAVDIADFFLKDDKLIVYSKGRNPFYGPRHNYRTKDETTHPDYPLVILVDGASASASEIVSGALKQHERAVLVGEKTFGKGSVQQLIQVRATGGRSVLRLTIAKYYLPDGSNIHGEGIAPDIVVEPGDISAVEEEQTGEVLANKKVDAYVARLWKEHHDQMVENARFDGNSADSYPDFETFYQSLETGLPADRVRNIVRSKIRQKAQDERGQRFAADIQEDRQLQRGALVILEKMGMDPSQYSEYRSLPEQFSLGEHDEEGESNK